MKIRTMTHADIPLGMKLSAQNGWNQLEADWRRQLDLEPAGCFVAEEVGTACACVFGNVAWIALVLVDANARGQGIGTALMKHVIAWLDSRGVESIRLDATPLGRPIYEKLGFVAEYQLNRYAGNFPTEPDAQWRGPAELLAYASSADLAEICHLDWRVTGADRTRLLQRLFQERPDEMRVVRSSAGIEAFVTARPGARAWQVGPCVGSARCQWLLVDVSRRHAGQPVFLDVPADHIAAVEFAKEMGLTVQRTLLRMGRGPIIAEVRDAFWSSYGPEKG